MQSLSMGSTPPPRGGGGGLTPKFSRYVPRQIENGPGLRTELHGRAWKCGAPYQAWAVLSVKMQGSGPSLSRFERENAGLRNCQDASGWHWPAANPGRCRTLCVRAEPAVGDDERVEIKEILKIMVSGTAKKCKMVMLWTGFFGYYFVKMICSGTDI